MKHETVHMFDEKGKLVLPDTRHLGKLLGDRHDQLAQAARDRNFNVTKDISLVVHMENDGFRVYRGDEQLYHWSHDDAPGLGMSELLTSLGFEATEEEVY